MTWLWRICFSGTALGLALTPGAAATLTGAVTLAPADDKGGRKIRDHSGVVVWLEPKDPADLPRPTGGPKRAVMEQRDKTFLPHVLAVEVGTTVDLPNFDPIFHNAFSNYDGQVFDLHLYAPQTTRKVLFRRPGMVRVFCNIHSTMSAVIAVLPTPYFAVTGADGKFEIQAPPGAYRFQVWHERSQTEALTRLERQITLPAGGLTMAAIRVPDEGFLAVPHKNKYGRDYPPQREEHVYYPGARR
jgi:plastocyanin